MQHQKKRKVFVLDLDGVLADFIQGFTKFAAQVFPKENIPVYSTYQQKVWNGFAGLDEKMEGEVWKAVLLSPTFWADLEPLNTADEWEALESLSLKSDVYFATNRVGIDPRYQSIAFLEKHGIFRPQVVVTKRKGEFCKCVGATYALDDKADNASAIAWTSEQHNGITRPYLIDRQYNRYNEAIIGSKHVIRVPCLGDYINACNAVL